MSLVISVLGIVALSPTALVQSSVGCAVSDEDFQRDSSSATAHDELNEVAPRSGAGPAEVPNDGLDNHPDRTTDYEDMDCAPSGIVYYVSSSSGNDAWDGLFPEHNGADRGPKQTTTAISSLLNNNTSPGDCVLLKRTDVWDVSSSLTFSTVVGTELDPIILGAYGSGSNPQIINESSTSPAVLVRGTYNNSEPSQWFIIENLTISSSRAPGDRGSGLVVNEGVRPLPPHHIIIRQCIIEDNFKGISLLDTAGDICVKDCILRNNFHPSTAPEDKSWGLYSASHRIIVRNNEFDNNGGGTGVSWHVYISSRTEATIEGNTFRNAFTGLKVRRMEDTIVRGNTFYDIRTSAMIVGGDQNGPSRNIVIEQNRFYNCGGGLIIKHQDGTGGGTEGIIVRNNLFYSNDPNGSDGYSGYLFLKGPDTVTDGYIYNNTFCGIVDKPDLRVGFIDASVSTVWIRNNIFVKPDITFAPLIEDEDADNDYNLFHVPSGTVAGAGPNAVFGDPRLRNPAGGDFSLTLLSLLSIDHGDDAAGIVDQDFQGIARPQRFGYDIGAFELSPLLFKRRAKR